MADRIFFVQVAAHGKPGTVLGDATLDGDAVTATPGIAAETIEMLARRFRMPEAAIFSQLRDEGWSNGAVMVTANDPGQDRPLE